MGGRDLSTSSRSPKTFSYGARERAGDNIRDRNRALGMLVDELMSVIGVTSVDDHVDVFDKVTIRTASL